ncbi:MAG: hypothetical protein M9894_04090 [Planctomycetes bacterium]|nr:hypothetical protein [Planctomycetota bacterium]
MDAVSTSAAPRRAARLAAAAALLVLGGAALEGCGDSRRRGLLFDRADDAIAANSPAIVGHAAGQLALQAALAAMEPGTFTTPQARPHVQTSGTATNGTVVLDFGDLGTSGARVNEATLRGLVVATYARSGAAATVTVSFQTLLASTAHLGLVDVFGTLTYACTISGSTCAGVVSGAVTTDGGFDTTTVQTSSVSFTLSAGSMVLAGTSVVTSTARGAWTITYAGLTSATDPPAARFISTGTAVITRASGSLAVSLLFTGPNQGTLTLSPGGGTRSFKL